MDEPDLLHVLDAYGQEFLNRFSPVEKRKSSESSAGRPSKSKRALQDKEYDQDEDEFEEWHGIENINEETSGEEKLDSGGEYEQDDDPFTSADGTKAPAVVVFSGSKTKVSTQKPTIHSRAFMSSKISRLREGASVLDQPEDAKAGDDEKTNAQNDALLHRLIHTTLLSGSLNPELDMTSAERRRALSGRVLELAGDAKLGKGETKVRITERNKAAKRVREGLWKKQRERELKRLEEAKNVGNYHPSIKKLFEGDGHPSFRPKKRTRGLKMGVGRFSAGTLRLSQKDVSAIEGGYTREPTGRRGKVKHKSPKKTSPP